MPSRIPSQNNASNRNPAAEALRETSSQAAPASTSQSSRAPMSLRSAALGVLNSFRATHAPATASTVAALSQSSAPAPARNGRAAAGRSRISTNIGSQRNAVLDELNSFRTTHTPATSLTALDGRVGGGSNSFRDHFRLDGTLSNNGTDLLARLEGGGEARELAVMRIQQFYVGRAPDPRAPSVRTPEGTASMTVRMPGGEHLLAVHRPTDSSPMARASSATPSAVIMPGGEHMVLAARPRDFSGSSRG